MLDAKLKALIARAPRWPVLQPPVARELMPRHIAIIMDGNGRWATNQGLMRINGHQAGVTAVRAATRYCGQVHVQTLTLYAFSTENWKRPQAEVKFLFRLLKKYLVDERPELMANGVRLTSIGQTSALPADVLTELNTTQTLTAANTGVNLCLAINYGAQDELLNTARELAAQVERGALKPEAIDAAAVGGALYTAGMPAVDLLIRTAGERRLSNFLLWQSEGAEFYATPVCWPDFAAADLEAAIREYARRVQPA